MGDCDLLALKCFSVVRDKVDAPRFSNKTIREINSKSDSKNIDLAVVEH